MKRVARYASHVEVARRLRLRMTAAERALWRELQRRGCGVSFRRQVPISTFIVDFFAPDCLLAVEVDGPVHDRQQTEDTLRDERLARLDIEVLRFTNDDVINDLRTVVHVIRERVEQRLTAPRRRGPTNNPEPHEGGTAPPGGGEI